MSIKISEKIISIPPYISASWSHVAALRMRDHLLSITLTDGQVVTIPNLSPEVIEQIFSYHAAYLDEKGSSPVSKSMAKEESNGQIINQSEPVFRLVFGSLDGLGTIMQHNSEQADGPDLPPEILQKIQLISKMITVDDALIPQAELFCNCFHCQIVRTLQPSSVEEESSKGKQELEESINDKDLEFQQWDITQTGEKIFSVVNRLDQQEKYNVYLGDPVGCTCGKRGCEHILAVLKT